MMSACVRQKILGFIEWGPNASASIEGAYFAVVCETDFTQRKPR
jgi:hypothetical protein